MQALAVFDYPEFFMAALLGFLLLASGRREKELHFPYWFAQAATASLSFLPASYFRWVNCKLMCAGWRTKESFGNFASLKLSLTLVSLLFAFWAPLYAMAGSALIVWLLPDVILIATVNKRQREIHNSLPQALD